MAALTDEQMAAMEAPQSKGGLTDEQMAAHEAQDPAEAIKNKYEAKYGKPDIGASIENMAGARLLSPAKSAWGRIAQSAGMSGARAAGHDSGDAGSKAKSAALSGLLGGGLSAIGEGVAAGSNKLADYLMQKAVGMRKNTPGVGNRLVDQGLVGTKSMLAGQVERKLPESEQAVQDVVSSMQDSAPGSEITNAVSAKGQKFINPDNGQVFSGKEGSMEQVRGLADKLSGTQEYSPGALLKLKRASDYEGYTASGNPATSLKAELEQAQADKARELLSKMSGGKSAEALSNEQALILANKALTKPEVIHQGMGSTGFFGKVPGQALFGSSAAQALQKTTGNADIPVDPRVLPLLFGEKGKK